MGKSSCGCSSTQDEGHGWRDQRVASLGTAPGMGYPLSQHHGEWLLRSEGRNLPSGQPRGPGRQPRLGRTSLSGVQGRLMSPGWGWGGAASYLRGCTGRPLGNCWRGPVSCAAASRTAPSSGQSQRFLGCAPADPCLGFCCKAIALHHRTLNRSSSGAEKQYFSPSFITNGDIKCSRVSSHQYAFLCLVPAW